MRSAHKSRRQAEAEFDGIDADYDEVFAAQARAVSTTSTEELFGVLDLLDQIEAELDSAQFEEAARVPRFLDQRRAAREFRRTEATVLRALPTRLDVADLIEGEAA